MKNFFEKYRLLIKDIFLTIVCIAAIFITVKLTSNNISNATIVTFVFLVIILFSAFFGNFFTATSVSLVAALCFNYFYLPPVGTFRIYSIADWISLFVFLLTAIAISSLTSSSAKIKKRNILLERTVSHYQKFSFWLLSKTDDQLTLTEVAKEALKLFHLQYCSIHVYSEGRWQHYSGSASSMITKEIENLIAKKDHIMDVAELSEESSLGVRYFQIKKAEQIFALLAAKDRNLPSESLSAIAYLIGLRLSNVLF
jgi:two-component system sensor histidine kinase KdpD